MMLPANVRACMEDLEQAGFAVYAVGGCVRDHCLGLIPHDFDLCTSALPEQTEAVFSRFQLVLAGKKHGTVTVIRDHEPIEITTFRTEGAYTDHRHPEWVKFVPTIEEDLARRDFTVNAMAWSPTRGFADPFGGRDDLRRKTLRAVGDPTARFQEDALRILRGVRFSVKYGLTPEKATLDAMVRQRLLMEDLARERVMDELCKLLPLVSAGDLLDFAPILATVIPELEPQFGFDQCNAHHAYDLFTHTAHVVAAVPQDLTLRWAALLHDVGKIATFTKDAQGIGHFYGHAQAGAEAADTILRRLKAPNVLREQAVLLIRHHMTTIEPERKIVRRWLSRLGPDLFHALLILQEADAASKGTAEDLSQFTLLRELSAQILSEKPCLTLKDLAIGGKDLMALGFAPGKQLGKCLNHLLELVLDEQVPNEKEALLSLVQSFGRDQIS